MNDVCQRWREGSSCMRPSREVVDTKSLSVVELDEVTAKAFVTRHHYSKRFPAARFRFGLYQHGDLVGVAVFSRPFLAEVITNVFPDTIGDEAAGVELGRFVLLDEVGPNAETWFLKRCFKALRGRVRGVVSFSDPTSRTRADGELVFPGHIGTIYQAKGARYLGRTDRRSLWILPDGTVFSNLASGKIYRGLTGWRGAVDELVRFGAEPLESVGCERSRVTWLKKWRTALTRTIRHEGLHRYAFRIDPTTSIPFGPDKAYPKKVS